MAVCTAMVLLGVPLTGGGYVTDATDSPKIDIANATVKMKSAHDLYCGDTIDLENAFTLEYESKTLVRNSDYACQSIGFSYGGTTCNVCKAQRGHAVVTVQGIGEFAGSTKQIHLPDGLPHVYVYRNLGEDYIICGNLVAGGQAVAWLNGGYGKVTLDICGQKLTSYWDTAGPHVVFNVPAESDISLSVVSSDGLTTIFSGLVQKSEVSQLCPHWLTSSVTFGSVVQNVRVLDTHGMLPTGTTLKVEPMLRVPDLDDTHPVEQLQAYNITLLNPDNVPITGPWNEPVELWLEIPEGFDESDLEVVLANSLVDREFEERIEDMDGKRWIVVQTDHFSPYVLIDKLNDDEKAALARPPEETPEKSAVQNTGENKTDRYNVKTGDAMTTATVACLGMVLVMALGVMLRLVNTKRFDA